MLKHMVMFKKRADLDDDTLNSIVAQLEAMVGQIPCLMDLKCYRALPSDRPVVYTFLLDSTLDDVASLPAYLQHPAHIAINERLSAAMESRAVVDYEV